MPWKYKGYDITIDENGMFHVHTDGKAVRSSSETLATAREKIDALEAKLKRDRERPQVPVIRENGQKATANGYNARNGLPNVGKDTAAHGWMIHVKQSEQLVTQLIIARQQIEQIRAKLERFRLPSVHDGSAAKIAEAEVAMADLYRELLEDPANQ